MKRIYVVRHGQTYINRYNKMQGWCDTPLTEPGIEGAEKAGEALKDVPFDIALSSDLKRASDTCEIIMKHNVNKDELQHLASPFFREQFYGYFEGLDSEMAWRMIGGSHGYATRQELFAHESIDTTGLRMPTHTTMQKTLKNIGHVLIKVLSWSANLMVPKIFCL